MFTIKNFWQLYDLRGIQAEKDFVSNEIEKIDLKNFEVPKNIFIDNFNQILHESDAEFIEKYESELVNANAFNFTNLNLDYGTWQERYLLNMVNISFMKRKIQPMFSTNDGSENPDITMWTEEILEDLKIYFANEVSDFIIETISYVLHGNEMSVEVKTRHIELLLEYLKDKEDYAIINCSSFKIVSYVFEDKLTSDILENEEYRALLEWIHSEEDIDMIESLQEYRYPISRKQKNILNEYYRTKYETIDEINDLVLLTRYLNDKDIVKEIDQEYFEKLKNKFRKILNKESGVEIASLFIDYMGFLFQLSNNQKIEKQNRQIEIIKVQNLWQKDYYEEQVSNLQVHTQKLTIPSAEIESINQLLLNNPLGFLNNLFPSSDENLIEKMQSISSTPLYHMVSKIEIKEQFPERDEIDLKDNSIDEMLAEKINETLETRGYKFRNIMKVEEYLTGVHEQKKRSLTYISNMINLEELYSKIYPLSEYPLIEYHDNILVAHLTQLFPLLEIKIRDLSKIIGISPYKNNMRDFMKYNDPSTLLKKMIENIYRSSNSFENIPDLLFVYNTMYNSNSLNIRNESIHGREYLLSSQLRFAIVSTLISILAIDYRIKLILNAEDRE